MAGFLFGLSAITRPNVLAFCPFLAGWIVWLQWPNWRASLSPLALFSIACAAPILPITVHNEVWPDHELSIQNHFGQHLDPKGAKALQAATEKILNPNAG